MKSSWNSSLEIYEPVYEEIRHGDKLRATAWIEIPDRDTNEWYEQYFCFQWREGSIEDVELVKPNNYSKLEEALALKWFAKNSHTLEWEYIDE